MKIIIFIIILRTISYTASAQENSPVKSAQEKQNKPPKPNSKVGIMVGRQGWKPYDNIETSDSHVWEISKGIGISAFYNYTYDHNFFFQFGINYNTYKTQTHEYTDIGGETGISTHKQNDDIAVIAGFNGGCYSDKIYIGMETGLCSQLPINGLFPLFYLQAGASFPIPKLGISIELNAKVSITNSGINIGLAYLIP